MISKGMLSTLDTSSRQIFIGNILFSVCCMFYLLWWILAFKPVNPIKGFKTGWLLLPASISGLVAVIIAIHGIVIVTSDTPLLPNTAILSGGIIAYVALMFITTKLFNRPVTTELILIIGWLILALTEVNTLLGKSIYTHQKAVLFIVISVIATVINLVCYCLYYKLDDTIGFIDGMIPLVLVLLLTVGINIGMMNTIF